MNEGKWLCEYHLTNSSPLFNQKNIWKNPGYTTCMQYSSPSITKYNYPWKVNLASQLFVFLPFYFILAFSSVQSLICVWLFATPWITGLQASLSITNSRSLLRLTSTELVMPSHNLILVSPLPLPPSIFPSMRVFSSESVFRIRWPKYWSFTSASVLPMNIQGWFPLGLTGLISLQSKGLSGIFSNTTV